MQERLPPPFLSPLRIVIREGPSTVGASLTFANFFRYTRPAFKGRHSKEHTDRMANLSPPRLPLPSPPPPPPPKSQEKSSLLFPLVPYIPYRRTLTRTMHSWKESGGEKGSTPARPCTINTMCTPKEDAKKEFFKKSKLQKFSIVINAVFKPN